MVHNCPEVLYCFSFNVLFIHMGIISFYYLEFDIETKRKIIKLYNWSVQQRVHKNKNFMYFFLSGQHLKNQQQCHVCRIVIFILFNRTLYYSNIYIQIYWHSNYQSADSSAISSHLMNLYSFFKTNFS